MRSNRIPRTFAPCGTTSPSTVSPTCGSGCVADTAGEELLYEPGASTLATLRRPRAGGASATLRVPCIALDELVAQCTLDPPGLVKIDVEGAETDVLRGLSRTITRYRPIIVCELHDTNREVGAAFRGFGYEVTVLGLGVPVEEAPADAHVLAVPA